MDHAQQLMNSDFDLGILFPQAKLFYEAYLKTMKNFKITPEKLKQLRQGLNPGLRHEGREYLPLHYEWLHWPTPYRICHVYRIGLPLINWVL